VAVAAVSVLDAEARQMQDLSVAAVPDRVAA
jgi:hypothetical protein